MNDQPLELGGESPYSAYKLLSLAFNAGLLGVATSGAAKRVFAQPLSLVDFGLTAAAAHKIAHIVSHERVTMYLRSPFTRQKDTGKEGERKEVPKEHGLKRAIGELLTCPYCLAPWVSTALVAGHIFAPIPTRVVTTVFAATAVADWLTQLKSELKEVTEATVEQREAQKPADVSARVVSVVS